MFTTPKPEWALIKTATRKISRRRSCRCRLARIAGFASVGRGGPAKRCRSCCRPATRWFWAGPARLCFHGVDRVLPTLPAPHAPSLPAGAARVNLTLRRVS